MRRYTWDEISGLAEICALSQEQIMRIQEDLFICPAAERAEFGDLAWKLEDMILGQSDSVSPVFFKQGSAEYHANVCLAVMLLELIASERTGDMAGGDEGSDHSQHKEFVRSIKDIFHSSSVFSVFVLEAAADLFKNNLVKDQSEVAAEYLWLRQIFEKTDIHDSLLSYYGWAAKQEYLQVDSFFLRLFLLYSFLDPTFKRQGRSGKKQRVENTAITDILTGNLQLRAGTFSEFPDKDSGERSETGDTEDILEVLREYVIFMTDRDIDSHLVMISERLSVKNVRKAGAALEILIDQRTKKEKFLTRKNCLRMRYIDAALLLSLCKETEQSTEFEIFKPAWGKNEIAFIRMNHSRLIMLRADKENITAQFRTGDRLSRNAIAYKGVWSEQEIKNAGLMCKGLFPKTSQGSSFLFSFIYLRDYRTINEIEVSFDHRYRIEEKLPNVRKRSVVKIINNEPMLSFPYFYGEHIYSLTCLVGRNGSGKTSVVDFMRETFLAIKDAAEEGKLTCSNGVLKMTENDNQRYHLKGGQKSAKFFVIFRVDGKDRYLTNFSRKEFICSGLENLYPYSPIIGESEDFTEDDCTFAYFSQFHYPTGMYAAQHLGEEVEYRKIISRYVRDLSEENIDRWGTPSEGRRPGGTNRFNESLVHQLVYLMAERRGKDRQEKCRFSSAEEWIQADQLKVIVDSTVRRLILIGKIPVAISDIQKNELDLIEIINNEPNAFIGPFSSGQHSKFKFLSRLYWCLAGSSELISKYEATCKALCGIIKDYEVRCSTRLEEDDTGVLLFDEGDLCYHPEWQRSFISDITGMVSSLRKKDVQIIVTTNSPFMLSDILREDVFSMPVQKTDAAGLDQELPTYGQNIHMLLAHRFFMDNTMGKMSEETLKWLFGFFNRYQIDTRNIRKMEAKEWEEMKKRMLEEIEDRYKEYFMHYPWEDPSFDWGNCTPEIKMKMIRKFLLDLINQVGERIYRVALKNQYERWVNGLDVQKGYSEVRK